MLPFKSIILPLLGMMALAALALVSYLHGSVYFDRIIVCTFILSVVFLGKMKEELRSEEKFNVKISEKNGKQMTYTIAIVDEGLLRLTRYKTPNPHNHFYAREALGVKTWDLYDHIFGGYGGKIEKKIILTNYLI